MSLSIDNYQWSSRAPALETRQHNGAPMTRADVDDLLIRGGHVVDGTGGPGRDADVAIRDGRIVAIESRSRSARRVLDARGQVIAPGFIDIHTHSDFTLPLNPRAPPDRRRSRSQRSSATVSATPSEQRRRTP